MTGCRHRRRAAAVALGLSVLIGGGTVGLAALSRAQAADDPPSGRDLQATERARDEARARRAELERRAADARAEAEALGLQAREAAAAVQRQEAALAEQRDALARFESEISAQETALAVEREHLGRLTEALIRLRRQPPEAMIARDGPATAPIHAGILMGATLPVIEAEAMELREALEELARSRTEAERQRGRIDATRTMLEGERLRLAQLIEDRQTRASSLDSEATQEAARARDLAERANGIRDLLVALEADRVARAPVVKPATPEERAVVVPRAKPKPPPPPPPPPPPAPVQVARTAPPPPPPPAPSATDTGPPPRDPLMPRVAGAPVERQVAALPPPAPGAGMVRRLPVSGRIIARFGEPREGVERSGITYETPAGATVLTPFAGRVAFAGPFRHYGLLLIVEHGDGYHTLLAGFGRLDARVGDRVTAGDPVGAMADGGGTAYLYLEVRRGGDPVDPAPLLARANGG
ncbi:peptidoglycan DD-metalloendopeptidase family protein [Tistrella bauzanensis]|uniref:murein hydrolase activator EnvC family protein n=1 Tax=Tistrella TaxID=171436 RepID=UPI0031F653B6